MYEEEQYLKEIELWEKDVKYLKIFGGNTLKAEEMAKAKVLR